MICPISSHLSPSRPQLYSHLRTRIYVIPLYLSMPWSRVNTGYSIHLVLDTLHTASSQDGLSPAPNQSLKLPADLVVLNSLHSHNYKLTNEQSVSFHRTCLPIYRLQIHCLQIDCLQIDRLQINHLQINRLQVLLQSWSIMASKCISQQAQLWLPSASLRSHDLGLQVHLRVHSISVSKPISKPAWSRPPSTSSRSNGCCTGIQG